MRLLPPAAVLATTLVACADASCPAGWVVDAQAGECIRLVTDQGADAGASDAGVDAGPCGGPCEGLTPFCSPLLGECVGCLSRDHCAASTPVCSLSLGGCVECATNSDCLDQPGTPRCFEGRCAECRERSATTDCASPSASTCSDGSCVACTLDEHCSHLAGRPLCDDGTCIGCHPASEAADCGAESCDPATLTCSGIARGSRSLCQACVSDSDCSQATGLTRCVPMHYQGQPRGGYCLEVAGDCAGPYLSAIVAASLSGAAPTTYCGIDQAAVTCDAVVALREGRQCPGGDPAECLAESALCETVGTLANHCTHPCSGAAECPEAGSASTCNLGYCGS